ncbi:MAG: acyl-CoA synthetase [Alphaproteobacteria bacterium HGW-Alphaproteobacteria-18]|nr:MAG: acyl-CoA synthetase [Alphaproteobacteria bacterium HGW-Alphaproteobacteria-18]
MDWNFGDMLDAVGDALGPNDPALIHGDRTVSWPEMTARSNRMARALHGLGAKPGDKAGFYLRNQPEYMEALAACFKARLAHVNVNYRYRDDELVYIFDNSDAAVVFFDTEFSAEVERVRARLPKVVAWVQIGGGEILPFAHDYEKLASEGDASKLKIPRSGDDLLLLYTGGTTGMPKGVMWTHSIWREAGMEGVRKMGGPVPENLDEHVQNALTVGKFSRQIPACPLMHGTGLFTAMGAMLNGGAIVTLTDKRKFDPVNLWDTVHSNSVTSMAIVGDAFAKPMLKTLDENPGRWNLSSMLAIISSGVMWSSEVKQGLLRHMPQVALTDSFGASEAVGFGSSITTADGGTKTSKFEIGPNCKVFTEDGREVLPGSAEPGYIARGGAVPLGYYKDPEKTEKTYKVYGGMRYAVPGDWCTVEADGTITLLGRGSNCINTAGEKVYPEEVEEALKSHAAVTDALVVGVPDDKWGQAITAVVSLNGEVTEDELRAHVQSKIARYKAPKRILFKDDLGRASNGKADYKSIKTFALQELGIPG